MNKENFLTKTKCDRCGQELKGGRIMSMFNEDIICKSCKEKEKLHPDYYYACYAVRKEEFKGNKNFKGIKENTKK